MTLVDIECDGAVERLAGAIVARIGFRQDDVVRKLACWLDQLAPAERHGFVARVMAAPSNDSSWIDLVQHMLVHETYFFRHPAQLELLRDRVLVDLDAERRAAGRGVLAVWNAACSTGEETWTLALLAGADGERAAIPLQLLATDISEAALSAARTGVYDRQHGLDSFRAIPPWALKHFETREGRAVWYVPDGLRRGVSFQAHNLIDPPPMREADLVICRNALIYFNEAAKRRALRHLAMALRPGGVLVLGAADTPYPPDQFEPITSSNATAYRKIRDVRS